MPFSPPKIDRLDGYLAVPIVCVVFLVLLVQLDDPGITWDEGDIQFPVAKKQAQWIHGLTTLEHPFSRETLDAYWFTTSDHPSLHRTLSAVSLLVFSGWLDEIIALRLPSVIHFSALLITLYLFLRLFLDRLPALAGMLSLALMPRIFGHAHLFSLDVPIMCWWFWSGIAAFLVYHGKLRPFWFGLVYAITFSTKLHAVFLPLPILLWIGFMHFFFQPRPNHVGKRIGGSVLWVLLLTPFMYIATQPWLWHDTWPRIMDRFFHYAGKTPIPLYFLGDIYRQSNPWLYPLVMVGLTVPTFILILAGWGLLSPWKKGKADERIGINPFHFGGIHLLLVLLFLTPLLIVYLSKIYDGCRLFLPCFPLLACFAGFGYQGLMDSVFKKWSRTIVHFLLMGTLLLPSLMIYIHIHPYYLAYYNELSGGIAGARQNGMETTYWCDALTRDFLDEINRVVPVGKTVKPSSMSFGVYTYYRERGWLKPSIADPADFYLLQSRQGMFSQVERFLYYRRKPVLSITLDGVQLYGLYKAPDQTD